MKAFDKKKWIKFLLAELFLILLWHLSWVTGFNPILVIGMIFENDLLFMYLMCLVLSCLTTLCASSILKWTNYPIWLVSLVLTACVMYFTTDAFYSWILLWEDDLGNMTLLGIIELLLLLYDIIMQFLYISIYKLTETLLFSKSKTKIDNSSEGDEVNIYCNNKVK